MAFFQCALRPKSARRSRFLAGVIAGVHIDDLFLKEQLDRLLDLDLVRARANPKDVLVELLAQQRGLLGQLDGLD